MKKTLLWIAIVLIILTLAAILGQNYAVKHYSNKVITIKEKIAVRIGDINVSLLKGGLVLHNVELLDTLTGAATGNVESVTVSGIRWIRLITGGGFSMRNLTIENAEIELRLNRLKSDTTTATVIDSIGVAQGNSIPGNALDTIDKLITFTAPMLNIRFDSEMKPELHGLDIKNFEFRPGQGKYNVDIAGISAVHGIDRIELDSFMLIPRYSKYDFGFEAGRRLGRIDILVEKILVHDFDLKALVSDSTLAIGNIICERGYVDVFSDKRLDIDMERYGPLPNEALLNASTKIAIDSIIAKDVDVKYASLNPATMEEGYLEFKRSYVSIYNVTNIPERIEKQGSMYVDMESKFTNEGELNAHFDFALNRKDYRIKWNGTLGRMKLGNIDSFVVPIANLNIIGGFCHSLKFSIVSDYDTSRGTLDFQYANLKIMAMDAEHKKEKRFLSGVANTFIVHSGNLVGDVNYIEGVVNFGRRKYKGFPDYVWGSLEHGIMYTILPKGIAKSIEKKSDKPKKKSSSSKKKKRRDKKK